MSDAVEVQEGARSEPIPGDRQKLTIEQRRPAPRWIAAAIAMVVVVTLVGSIGYVARAKLQEVFSSRLRPKPADTADDAGHRGTRVFAAEPAVTAAGASDAANTRSGSLLVPMANLPGALGGGTGPVVPAPSGNTGAGAAAIPLAATAPSGAPGYAHQASPGSPAGPATPVPLPSMLVDALQDAPGQPPRTATEAPPPAPTQSGTLSDASFGTSPNGGLQSALKPSITASSHAGKLAPRDLLLARGSYVPCVLETQLISNIAGFTSCIVTDNIYSDDGHTVLIERGAHIVGEYKSDVHNGDTRLFVLWDRIKTRHGVTIELDSPGGDAVGGMGLPGYVDNHWFERIGAAFMLSIFQDAIAIEIARQSAAQSGTGTTINTTPSNTTGASQDMAKEVLNSTINIPPTIYKNRGEMVMVYVARDLWFDSVYEVR